MARNNLAAKKLASAAARVLTSDTATPAEISCAAHALIQRQLEVTKCDLKMKMPTSDYLKKLMAPIPAIAPLRTHMTVAEYEDVVNRMDLRIAELEAALTDIINLPQVWDEEMLMQQIAREALIK